MARWVVAVVLAVTAVTRADNAAPSRALVRTFRMTCQITLPAIAGPVGKVELWMPAPASDAQQTIAHLHVDSKMHYEYVKEAEYGNRVIHLWSNELATAEAVLVTYDCTRAVEHAGSLEPRQSVSILPEPGDRLLREDRMGVIDPPVRSLAMQVTSGQATDIGRARAIYDYVVKTMTYDKTAPGWGEGDTRRACDLHKGNCTDFHALFISLARASGIPARFGIGYALPPGKHEGEIVGYHCWAEFWLPGQGWIPVDASEAWKHPAQRDFYFGNLDPDRVRMSVGRDVRLPGAKAEPLNYFLSPYAEVDGRVLKGVHSTVRFIDLVPEAALP